MKPYFDVYWEIYVSEIRHLVISVRGMLNWSNAEAKRNLKWVKDNDGNRFLSVAQMRNALMDELAKGHEVLPMCECDNHDWKMGCQGHPEEDKGANP